MKDFDYFAYGIGLAKAHVSASTSPAPGTEPTTLADEVEAPASHSFEVAENAEIHISTSNGTQAHSGNDSCGTVEGHGLPKAARSEYQASPAGMSLTISPLQVVMLSGDYFPYQRIVDASLKGPKQ
jgi:hypothetical protein